MSNQVIIEIKSVNAIAPIHGSKRIKQQMAAIPQEEYQIPAMEKFDGRPMSPET